MWDLIRRYPVAFVLALLMHLGIVALMVFGLDWLNPPEPQTPRVNIVQATLIDERELHRAEEEKRKHREAEKRRKLEAKKKAEAKRKAELERKRKEEARRKAEAKKPCRRKKRRKRSARRNSSASAGSKRRSARKRKRRRRPKPNARRVPRRRRARRSLQHSWRRNRMPGSGPVSRLRSSARWKTAGCDRPPLQTATSRPRCGYASMNRAPCCWCR